MDPRRRRGLPSSGQRAARWARVASVAPATPTDGDRHGRLIRVPARESLSSARGRSGRATRSLGAQNARELAILNVAVGRAREDAAVDLGRIQQVAIDAWNSEWLGRGIDAHP